MSDKHRRKSQAEPNDPVDQLAAALSKMHQLSYEAVKCGRAEERGRQAAVDRKLKSLLLWLQHEVEVGIRAVLDRVSRSLLLSKTVVSSPSVGSSYVVWNPDGPVKVRLLLTPPRVPARGGGQSSRVTIDSRVSAEADGPSVVYLTTSGGPGGPPTSLWLTFLLLPVLLVAMPSADPTPAVDSNVSPVRTVQR